MIVFNKQNQIDVKTDDEYITITQVDADMLRSQSIVIAIENVSRLLDAIEEMIVPKLCKENG